MEALARTSYSYTIVSNSTECVLSGGRRYRRLALEADVWVSVGSQQLAHRGRIVVLDGTMERRLHLSDLSLLPSQYTAVELTYCSGSVTTPVARAGVPYFLCCQVSKHKEREGGDKRD